MSQHHANVQWQYVPHDRDPNTYSRNHVATLNGQQSVNVSSSVEYKGDPACSDPEQLLVTSVASCHMLTFLAIAEYQGYRVEHYEDDAIGYLEKAEGGGMAVTRIELAPRVVFGGCNLPDDASLSRIFAAAHKNCFIANSIKTKVSVVTAPVPA